MELALAVILKPFFYLALFVVGIYPAMWLAWKVLPDSRFRQVLFDRTLRDRRPWLIGLTQVGVFLLVIVALTMCAQQT